MKQKDLSLDSTLLVVLLGLLSFSLLSVYSGSGQYVQEQPFYFVIRQLIWYAIGAALMLGLAYFDYELLTRWAFPLYLASLSLLFLVPFIGITKNGSQRWISLGVFDLQPSEFMKITLILCLAHLFQKMGQEKLPFGRSVLPTLKGLLYILVPAALVLLQPDLGSSLMILAAGGIVLFVSNISTKMISLLLTIGTSVFVGLVWMYVHAYDTFTSIFKPHQLGRIYGWLNPQQFASGYGYQLKQSILGIGSGQLVGKGITGGDQVQSGRVPEAHTDFIFAVIGEELGFMGASLLICLYFLLIYRIMTIAFRANDLFGVYICVGTIGLIAFQVFQNIGMTIGLMPITGLALPFISYGGSALLTNMMALGLVFSVHRHSKAYWFGQKPMR
ncbi:rod shape-determining protein RodA [Halobacillus karajensis]|nr:rod shape-determining protein RodA [Halobacillus karajensis]